MTTVDLRGGFPPVRTQRSLLACSALVLCDAIEWHVQHGSSPCGSVPPFVPSPLFVYYNARKRTGHENQNIAVCMPDAMAAVAEYGVCPEDLWPYDLGHYRAQPPPEAYAAARAYAGISFETLPQDWDTLRARLDANTPFFFCLRLYGSNGWQFETGDAAATGRLPMPQPGDPHIRNHALLAVGYDAAASLLIVRNSFGEQWGNFGYGVIPLEYVLGARTAYAFGCVHTLDP